MKNIRLFVWDFDGTLFDTYPNIIGYLQKALRDCGYDAPYAEAMEQMLVNIPTAVRYYSEKYNLPDLNERFRHYKASEQTDPVTVFPKVKEVLARVREIGADNYIFTNRGDTIHSMLERGGILNDFREIITSASPCFKVKPAPDSILYLMNKYSASPETTLMIGDRVCDLESGYNCGCKTCHLLTPSVPQYPKCDWRIRDFSEMLEMLK